MITEELLRIIEEKYDKVDKKLDKIDLTLTATLEKNGFDGICVQFDKTKKKIIEHDIFIMNFNNDKKWVISIAVFISGAITALIKLIWK